MTVTNDFLTFCDTDTGTNLPTQSVYLADPNRAIGNQPGVASSKLTNKPMRQATFVAGQLAQFISDRLAISVLDDGVEANLQKQIVGVFKPLAPAFQSFLSGSGTYNQTYHFYITSGNATLGATYTNNSITFTVVATVASSTTVRMTGSNVPTSSGTLTKTGGTGDSTLTFNCVRSPLYLEVEMVGGGAGGGGSGTGTSGGSSSAGGNSTFGSSLLTANGAGGVVSPSGGNGAGSAGGTAAIGAAVGKAYQGGQGQTGQFNDAGHPYLAGGQGGQTPFAGGGASNNTTSGFNAVANTGSGGAGGGTSSTASVVSGGGGGAGGYVKALIYSPAVTYAWVVGAGGAGGGAGTSGFAGGNGAAGAIYVTEFYQ